MSAKLLEVRDAKKHFRVTGTGLWGGTRGLLRAVDGVSFDLGAGESVGLVGESGSGKSTLARMIVGLTPPTSGSIRFDGTELCGLPARAWGARRRRIQMVFQDPTTSLDPRQRACEIVEEPMIYFGRTPRARRLRALALLDAVGLNPSHGNRFPHEFSGGQRQRLGIARALALEPELLVCDEPVSALDVSVQAQVINLLRELQQRFRLALLFISHDLAVVKSLCERVAVMYLGKLVEIAPSTQLYSAPRHPYSQLLLSAVPGGQRAADRVTPAGEPPSPVHPPPGCRFHPRCHRRDEVPGDLCRSKEPALEAFDEDRALACHLH